MSVQFNHIASWQFDNGFEEDVFDKNTSIQQINFEIFQKTIDLLIEDEILIPKILFLSLPLGEKGKTFDLDSFSQFELSSLLHEIILDNHSYISIKIIGSTVIFNGTKPRKIIDNNIILYYDLPNPNLRISFVNDIWTPIDRKWDWQIELSENNAYRIPKFF